MTLLISPDSKFESRRRPCQRRVGFTLLEMMTTVAALVIVLGLMASLARSVRHRAAVALTKDLLRQLDEMTTQYFQRHAGQLPLVNPFPPPSAVGQPSGQVDETSPGPRKALLEAASENNRRVVSALKAEPGSSPRLNNLPVSIYNEVMIRDAWGSPVVFMPAKHPQVGTAPNNRYFFFSAGPDRRFLTQDDNLYSYENLSLEQLGVVRH